MAQDLSDLVEELLPTFLDELEEHSRLLNEDLLALDRPCADAERAEVFRRLFRTAHTIKGASAMMNAHLLEEGCHGLEDVLGALRDNTLKLTPELLQLFFNTADAIDEIRLMLFECREVKQASMEDLIPRFALALMDVDHSEMCHNEEGSEPHGKEEPSPAPKAPPSVSTADSTATLRVRPEKLDRLLVGTNEMLLIQGRNGLRSEQMVLVKRVLSDCRAVLDVGGRRSSRVASAQPAVDSVPHKARAMLARLATELERLRVDLAADRRSLNRAVATLEEDARDIRLFPFAEACYGLERAVRDVARVTGKEADLVIEGGDVELDRSTLEALKSPLIHLVRNAVDHGLEGPVDREAGGKDRRGCITVRASLSGPYVEVTVSDDGRGINTEAVREHALRHGIVAAASAGDASDLIFEPGFSTASTVTEISGRGVGLDVVKAIIESLNGTLHFSSEPGRGTTFVLAVPLTLTTAHVLLLRAGGGVYAGLSASVSHILRTRPEDIRLVDGHEAILVAGQLVRLVSLADELGVGSSEDSDCHREVTVAVLASGDKRVAFAVDECLATERVVVKNLGVRLQQVPNISGATVLSGGKIALILNVPELVRTALQRPAANASVFAPRAATQEDVGPKRVLVVDDDATARALERNALTSAGYDVVTAVDGASAWEILAKQPIDMVVSDVAMPSMDGIALTEEIRRSQALCHLPVVLVTSCDSDADKARGLEAGANAYIVKSTFELGAFLETISQLV